MTYGEAIDFLFISLPMYRRVGKAVYKANLDDTLRLDSYFGHPHRLFPSVHVAGTNGKGSVSHMLASVFQESGYKTGLYTSPHLLDFRERIRINGKPIPEGEVTETNLTTDEGLKLVVSGGVVMPDSFENWIRAARLQPDDKKSGD